MPTIIKTKYFKPTCCNIDSIVGHKKAEVLRNSDSIDVSKEELEKIEKKNKNWFTVGGKVKPMEVKK